MRLAINLRTRPLIKVMIPINKGMTPITKVMTAINKDKSGSESGSIPSVHPCNSSMPTDLDMSSNWTHIILTLTFCLLMATFAVCL